MFHSGSYRSPAIICSIHQPSARVLNNFDKVYVLSCDGRCIYQGSPLQLLNHLANFNLICPQFHNPADFIIEIASGDYGIEPINTLSIEEMEREREELKKEKIVALGNGKLAVNLINVSRDRRVYVKVSKVIDKMKSRSFPILLHTWLLWKRTMKTNIREPKLTWFRLFQAVMVALLMGFLYEYPIGEPDGCYPKPNSFQQFKSNKSTEDNIAFLFFTTLFTVMASMMPTVLTFPSEVAILLQERNNGWYSCATYYVAKIIAETPIQILITLTFVSIIYPMTGQVWDFNRFGLFCLVSLLISSIAQCVGILFGTYYVKNVENAVFLAPLSMAPVFLMSGFFGKISTIPLLLKPLAYASYVRYAFESFLIILYGFNRCTNGTITLLSATSENVPQHILNTGYVHPNDIDSVRRMASKSNRTKLGSFKLQPRSYWGSTTPNPFIPSLPASTLSPSVEYDQPSAIPNYANHNPGHNTGLNRLNPFKNGTLPTNVAGIDDLASKYNNISFLNSGSGISSDQSTSGSYVMSHFNLTDDVLLRNLIILIGFLLVLRITCYVVLLSKTNRRS